MDLQSIRVSLHPHLTLLSDAYFFPVWAETDADTDSICISWYFTSLETSSVY